MKTAYPFPFGIILLEYEDDVLTGLSFGQDFHSTPEEDYRPGTMFSDMVIKQIREYLRGQRTVFDFKYRLEGTDFQKKVWNALLRIPYGETRSYQQIAAEIGNPKASRAVGMANHKNPIGIVVPCHRVIGADGSLTGYAGGIEMKKYLLELERAAVSGEGRS